MDLSLSGRRAVVLGASRGLGLATALAAEGAFVLLCDRNEALLADAVRRLKAASGTAAYRLVDLAEPAGITAFAESLGAEPVDILINNTGGPPPSPVSAVAAVSAIDNAHLSIPSRS